jgi:hypothetical protein
MTQEKQFGQACWPSPSFFLRFNGDSFAAAVDSDGVLQAANEVPGDIPRIHEGDAKSPLHDDA